MYIRGEMGQMLSVTAEINNDILLHELIKKSKENGELDEYTPAGLEPPFPP